MVPAPAGADPDAAASGLRSPAGRRRVRVRVEGTVQGVGFRPWVYRLASESGVGGYVLNDERGVLLEAEADPAGVERFLVRLSGEGPPLARVERVASQEVPPIGELGFEIRLSSGTAEPSAPVAPDAATCGECLAELFDPRDRRFRYPFINCTNCGPRFTIVRGVPYDRPLTTMAGFEMCELCRAEYHDPADRRFHAQPNACPLCGPTAKLVDAAGPPAVTSARDPVQAAAVALQTGRIVAVKGIGGFHLVCRADHEEATATLRSRKHREDKPFALMVPDVEAADQLVDLGIEEKRLLASRQRPIVLAAGRPGGAVAEAVAPGSRELGVMLPYSPLHHLLLSDAAAPLVMTSGNVSDEPIAYRDEDALDRLAAIADLFLLHDRPIHTRTDDSVVRAVDVGPHRQPLMLRRSRGYVPAALELPVPADRHVLACGAELKNTFCVAKGRRAWVGHHVGDLKNYQTLRSFQDGVEHFERLFAIDPEVVAHDLHPDYLSTRYALERAGVEHLGVQHHHAHLAACLAEHGEEGPALGAIYDGTGYGLDGTVWGGELLLGGLAGFERVGSLWPVRMPGGERAIREPWRMACAWLVEAMGEQPPLPRTLEGVVEPERWRAVAELARTGLASPVTSSVGRLFDAVAALCGLRATVNYEGQAAVELEATRSPDERGSYSMTVIDGDAGFVLDARETIQVVAREAAAGVPPSIISARFHAGVAESTARACATVAARTEIDTVALSGGVFQNRAFLELTSRRLIEAGLRVLTPRELPPNDGGIAYGQAAVAARTCSAAAE